MECSLDQRCFIVCSEYSGFLVFSYFYFIRISMETFFFSFFFLVFKYTVAVSFFFFLSKVNIFRSNYMSCSVMVSRWHISLHHCRPSELTKNIWQWKCRALYVTLVFSKLAMWVAAAPYAPPRHDVGHPFRHFFSLFFHGEGGLVKGSVIIGAEMVGHHRCLFFFFSNDMRYILAFLVFFRSGHLVEYGMCLINRPRSFTIVEIGFGILTSLNRFLLLWYYSEVWWTLGRSQTWKKTRSTLFFFYSRFLWTRCSL